jgi:hypothetical protein
MNFSLLLPSRLRENCLARLAESVQTTTADLQSVEMLVAVDDDCEYSLNFPFLSFHARERMPNISGYFNWLFPKCKGRFIWVLNDDAEICTANWDEILLDSLDWQVPCYGLVHPTRFNDEGQLVFSEFPVLSRVAIERLGYVMPETYPGWAADNAIGRIYRDCQIDCRDVVLRHYHEMDETHKNMIDISIKVLGNNPKGKIDVEGWDEEEEREKLA